METHCVSLIVRYIPGKQNDVVDHQAIPTDWSFLPRVFDEICRETHGRPVQDSLQQEVAHLCVSSPSSCSMEGGCILALMGPPRDLYLPFVYLHKKDSQQGHGIRRPLDGSYDSSVATQRVASGSVVSVGGRASAPSNVLESSDSALCLEVS